MAYTESENRERIRRHWNKCSGDYFRKRNIPALIDQLRSDPSIGFHRKVFEDVLLVTGRKPQKICVLASGDNQAVFALSVMGHSVTSVDISERQIENARQLSTMYGITVEYLVSDLLHLSQIRDETFDLVYTSNGVLTWIDNLPAMFGEVHRILHNEGTYILYDVHPFQRPWVDSNKAITPEKSYEDVGPIRDKRNEDAESFHWRVEDIINGLSQSGMKISWIHELGSDETKNTGYFWGNDIKRELNDWRTNPLAAMPAWIEIVTIRSA